VVPRFSSGGKAEAGGGHWRAGRFGDAAVAAAAHGLDQVAMAEAGELAFGTIDSWLIWQLTDGAVHATDVSNASRTLLFNVHSNQWDAELLQMLDIPPSMMPTVRPSSSLFGEVSPALLGHAIMIGGVAGDQQSALFGQACFKAGLVKNTYGTGCFMLMHTGATFQTSHNGLITTSAAQTGSQPEFALEGSVFVGGAVVQWLRDGLHAIQSSSEVEALAQSVSDSGGVMMVPAFTGLGAPYWQPDARGTITGLTRGSTAAHIARAALESIAYQSAALLLAMSRDAVQGGGAPVAELRVDGGACVNDLLMQFQADLLGIPVVRPAVTETTALGAAYLAGLATGVYRNTDELAELWRAERRFLPTLAPARAAELMARWIWVSVHPRLDCDFTVPSASVEGSRRCPRVHSMRSTTVGVFSSFFTRSKSIARNWSHSVISTMASAPSIAW
jgi:glycerol kinase